MIVEWFLQLCAGFVGWLGTLMPAEVIPAGIEHPEASLNGIFALVDGMGVWVDWPFVNTLVLATLGIWATCFGIRIVRAAVGHVPGFGGKG